MTDILSTAVVNRVFIVDLGIAAWPISLLVALRYIILSPFGLWVVHRSDNHPILGSRRVSYIWIGRLLMLLSLPILALSVGDIARDTGSIRGWALAVLSFLIYGLGTLISGGPYLALVHDSAPYRRRGQVIAIVQTILVASFAFVGVLYGMLLPVWEYQQFVQLVLFAIISATFFWFFSVWREERKTTDSSTAQELSSYLTALGDIWSDSRLRRYGIFLAVSALFAFMYDLVLEPFGGDVFGMEVGETTRFNGYWGSGVLVAMAATAYVTRRWPPDQQVGTTGLGLLLLASSALLLAGVSALQLKFAILPVLVFFGVSFGIFTVGGVALLMAMSRDEQAATYLALWSTIQLVFRGVGIAFGGILRDITLYITDDFSIAYALVFLVEALGLYACIFILSRLNVAGFVDQYRGSGSSSELIAATAD